MRMPSIRTAGIEALQTLRRFPLVLLAAVLAWAMANIVFFRNKPDDGLTATLATATLGLPLLTAIAITAERIQRRWLATLLALAGIAALAAFGMLWVHWSQAIQVRRYAQFSLAFHLMAAFLPYAWAREPNGFWHYNRTLFLRFLTAALYSGVLYLGLVLAFVALDKLLKVPIKVTTYSRLWLTISFLFNTWFFLGGVPRDLPALEARRDYPTGLKVFSQFILIPLVVIYLVILTLYLGRIVITGQWPSGWIGYLVSSVAAVGILSLLLVHPIRKRDENRWVGSYARWFYVALLPAIGMLLVSIWKRIDQYGITEDRYFIAILSWWLAGIAVLFVVRRDSDIRLIPITLCVLAFATAFGPQGAYTVSRRSQMDHLRRLVDKLHPVPGTRVIDASPRTLDLRKEMSSTLVYLLQTHGDKPVAVALGHAMPAQPDSHRVDRSSGSWPVAQAQVVMHGLGLEYATRWDNSSTRYFSYYRGLNSTEVVPLSGVNYVVRLTGALPASFDIEGKPWTFRLDARARRLFLTRSGKTLASFGADTLIRYARASTGQYDPSFAPSWTAESDSVRALLRPSTFSGNDGDSLELQSLVADLYLTVKSPLSGSVPATAVATPAPAVIPTPKPATNPARKPTSESTSKPTSKPTAKPSPTTPKQPAAPVKH